MICLIDTQETPDVGIFTRIRRIHRGYKGITARTIVILGVRALYISIDKTPSMRMIIIKKRIHYAAEKMRRDHVGKVLFSEKFTYKELVLREGFDEIDESYLMAALAGKIVSAFSGSDKVAAFFANRLTSDAERAFYDMCRHFRYVMAVMESDCGQLFANLGKRLGISVIGQPTEKQLSKADVAVFFSPPRVPTVLPEKCIAIPVNNRALDGVVYSKFVSEVKLALGNAKALDIPDGFAHEPLYAAAIDAGTLHREDVLLREVKIMDMYV